MKLKTLLFLAVLSAFTAVTSCKKTECQDVSGACSDTVPDSEACMAFFERWFYNRESGQCELIGYSGCNQKGFATESDCNACKH